MKTIIGKCSLCDGPVTTPTITWSVEPPLPTCQKCHAKAKLPTIQMDPHSRPYKSVYAMLSEPQSEGHIHQSSC